MSALMSASLPGCKDDPECRRNSDCKVVAGEICQKGKCRQHTIILPDSGSDTDSVGQADSATVDVVDTQSDVVSDTTVVDTESSPQDSTDGVGCVSNADCDDGNPCLSGYCNTALAPARCEYNPEADGVRCGDAGDPCAANAVCQAGECVGASPCESTTPPGGCIRYEGVCTSVDNAPSCSYTETPLADGTACYVGSPCQQGACEAGECVQFNNPCNNIVGINPCTSAGCEATGNNIGEFNCQISTAPDGSRCQLEPKESACYATPEYSAGVPGYCMFNGETSDCIINEIRPCYDADNPSICNARLCALEDGSCFDVPAVDVSIQATCGETVALAASDFITKDYYSYPGCLPMDARGKELALTVAIVEAANVTVTVVDDGGQDFKLYHLTDMCDPATCQSNAHNSLSVTNLLPTDAIIVEAGIGNPPESSQISITCN